MGIFKFSICQSLNQRPNGKFSIGYLLGLTYRTEVQHGKACIIAAIAATTAATVAAIFI
jgi:hypothetical protein